MERDFENQLKQIKRVNVPPGLFNRIEERMVEEKASGISTSWMVAACAGLFIMILTNVFVLSYRNPVEKKQELQSVTSTLYSTNNQLYYE